jgi:hypothetical protein
VGRDVREEKEAGQQRLRKEGQGDRGSRRRGNKGMQGRGKVREGKERAEPTIFCKTHKKKLLALKSGK